MKTTKRQRIEETNIQIIENTKLEYGIGKMSVKQQCQYIILAYLEKDIHKAKGINDISLIIHSIPCLKGESEYDKQTLIESIWETEELRRFAKAMREE